MLCIFLSFSCFIAFEKSFQKNSKNFKKFQTILILGASYRCKGQKKPQNSIKNFGGTTMNTYVMDFIKRLPRKQNIPVMIYLFVNLLILFFANFILVEAFITDISDGAALAISIPASIVIYAIGVVISLSPVGEWILRKMNHCKKFDDEKAEERVNKIFSEVLSRAKEINPSIPDDITLYYIDEEEVNAFATGRKTIGVTKGALELSDEQLKGILGHEIGHLANHDTDLTLVVNVANWFVTLYFLAIRAYMVLLKVVAKGTAIIFGFLSSSLSDLIMNLIICRLIDLIDFVLITLLSALWTGFGNLLIKASTRSNEYLADEFSNKLGYGEYLISVLQSFGSAKKSKNPLKRLAANLADTHPSNKKRIEAIRNSGVKEYAQVKATVKTAPAEAPVNEAYVSAPVAAFAPAAAFVPAPQPTPVKEVKPKDIYTYKVNRTNTNGACKKCQTEAELYRFTLTKNEKSSSACICENCCRAMIKKVKAMQ